MGQGRMRFVFFSPPQLRFRDVEEWLLVTPDSGYSCKLELNCT